MTPEELDRWSENTKVCYKTQGDIGIFELSCDEWGCLAVNSYESEEAAFAAGWRGTSAKGMMAHHIQITSHACPDCAKELA